MRPEMAGAEITMYIALILTILLLIYSFAKQLGRKFTNFPKQIIIR